MPATMTVLYVAREKPSAGRAPALQIFHTLRGLSLAAGTASESRVRIRYVTPWPERFVRRKCEELTGLALPAEIEIVSLGPGPAIPLVSKVWPAPVWSAIRSRLRRYLHQAWHEDSRAVVYTRNRRVAAEMPPPGRPPLVFENHSLRFRDHAERERLAPDEPRLERLREGERAALERADAVVTLTRALAEDLRAELGGPEKIAVIPDGAAPELFHVASEDRRPEPGRFVYAGSLAPWKGLETAFQALVRAPGASLDVLGGGLASPDGRAAVEVARSLGITGRVRFHGALPQPALHPFFASACAGILPLDGRYSLAARYTSPLKLFEYLCAGLPIVASDLPSIREVVAHEKEGLLFEDRNADALASTLRRLASEPGLARRLGEAARAASADYTWQRRGERILAVCEETSAARAARAAKGERSVGRADPVPGFVS